MAKNPLPTPEQLRQLLDYDPETGVLTWRERKPHLFGSGKMRPEGACRIWNAKHSGKVAGSDDGHGYLRVRVMGSRIMAHRVAWAIIKGEWPTGEIDHINHVTNDNRLHNLREVSHAANGQNVSRANNNTSGVTGVSWDATNRVWKAYITVDMKRRSLGNFSELADAVASRKSAERAIGFHPNHGR